MSKIKYIQNKTSKNNKKMIVFVKYKDLFENKSQKQIKNYLFEVSTSAFKRDVNSKYIHLIYPAIFKDRIYGMIKSVKPRNVNFWFSKNLYISANLVDSEKIRILERNLSNVFSWLKEFNLIIVTPEESMFNELEKYLTSNQLNINLYDGISYFKKSFSKIYSLSLVIEYDKFNNQKEDK